MDHQESDKQTEKNLSLKERKSLFENKHKQEEPKTVQKPTQRASFVTNDQSWLKRRAQNTETESETTSEKTDNTLNKDEKSANNSSSIMDTIKKFEEIAKNKEEDGLKALKAKSKSRTTKRKTTKTPVDALSNDQLNHDSYNKKVEGGVEIDEEDELGNNEIQEDEDDESVSSEGDHEENQADKYEFLHYEAIKF